MDVQPTCVRLSRSGSSRLLADGGRRQTAPMHNLLSTSIDLNDSLSLSVPPSALFQPTSSGVAGSPALPGSAGHAEESSRAVAAAGQSARRPPRSAVPAASVANQQPDSSLNSSALSASQLAEFAGMNNTVLEQEDTISDLRAALRRERARTQVLVKQNAKLQSEAHSRSTQPPPVAPPTPQPDPAVTQRLASLVQENTSLRDLLHTANGRADEVSRDSRGLKDALGKAEASLRACRSDLSATRAGQAAAQDSVRSQQASARQLQEQVEHLQRELTAARMSDSTAQQQVAATADAVAAASRAANAAEARASQLAAALQAKESELGQAQAQVLALQSATSTSAVASDRAAGLQSARCRELSARVRVLAEAVVAALGELTPLAHRLHADELYVTASASILEGSASQSTALVLDEGGVLDTLEPPSLSPAVAEHATGFQDNDAPVSKMLASNAAQLQRLVALLASVHTASRGALLASQDDLQALKGQAEALQRQMQRSEDARSQLEAECAALQRKLSQTHGTAKAAANADAALASRGYARELAAASAQLKDTATELRQCKAELAEMRTAYGALESIARRAQAARSAAEQRAAALESELGAAQQAMHSADAERAQARQQCTAAQQEADAARARLQALERSAGGAGAAVRAAEGAAAAAEQRAAQLASGAKRAVAARDSCQQMLQRTQTQLEHATAALAESRSRSEQLESRCSTLAIRCDALDRDIMATSHVKRSAETLQEELSACRVALDRAQAAQVAAEHRERTALEAAKAARADSETLRGQLQTAQAMHQSSQRRSATSGQEALLEAQHSARVRSDQLATTTRLLKDAQFEKASLQRQLADIKVQLRASHATLGTLRDELRDAHAAKYAAEFGVGAAPGLSQVPLAGPSSAPYETYDVASRTPDGPLEGSFAESVPDTVPSAADVEHAATQAGTVVVSSWRVAEPASTSAKPPSMQTTSQAASTSSAPYQGVWQPALEQDEGDTASHSSEGGEGGLETLLEDDDLDAWQAALDTAASGIPSPVSSASSAAGRGGSMSPKAAHSTAKQRFSSPPAAHSGGGEVRDDYLSLSPDSAVPRESPYHEHGQRGDGGALAGVGSSGSHGSLGYSKTVPKDAADRSLDSAEGGEGGYSPASAAASSAEHDGADDTLPPTHSPSAESSGWMQSTPPPQQSPAPPQQGDASHSPGPVDVSAMLGGGGGGSGGGVLDSSMAAIEAALAGLSTQLPERGGGRRQQAPGRAAPPDSPDFLEGLSALHDFGPEMDDEQEALLHAAAAAASQGADQAASAQALAPAGSGTPRSGQGLDSTGLSLFDLAESTPPLAAGQGGGRVSPLEGGDGGGDTPPGTAERRVTAAVRSQVGDSIRGVLQGLAHASGSDENAAEVPYSPHSSEGGFEYAP